MLRGLYLQEQLSIQFLHGESQLCLTSPDPPPLAAVPLKYFLRRCSPSQTPPCTEKRRIATSHLGQISDMRHQVLLELLRVEGHAVQSKIIRSRDLTGTRLARESEPSVFSKQVAGALGEEPLLE